MQSIYSFVGDEEDEKDVGDGQIKDILLGKCQCVM